MPQTSPTGSVGCEKTTVVIRSAVSEPQPKREGPPANRTDSIVRWLIGGNVRALDDLPRRVDEACALARILGESNGRRAHLHSIDPVEDDVHGDFRKAAFSIPLREKVSILADYARFMRGLPGITESAAWYQDIHSDVYLATSEGTFIRQEKMDNAFDQVLFEFLAKCLAEVA